MWEVIKSALKTLAANRMRSFLTMLGIIIAVMTVVSILSLVGGLDNYVKDQIGNLGANSFIITRMGMISSEEEYLEAAKRPDISLAQYRKLLRSLRGDYLYATPRVNTHLNLAYEGVQLSFIRTTGTGADNININERSLDSGRYFTAGEVSGKRAVTVIGYEVAQELFGNSDPIGKEIKVGDRPFTVIGTYAEQGKMMGQSMDDFIDIPYTTMLKSFGFRRSIAISLRAKTQEELPALLDLAEQEFRRIRGVKPDAANDFGIMTEDLLVSAFEEMSGVIFVVMIAVGAVSLLVGGIGIMNVMLVAVSERTREIGIRKAVGARRRDILNQFLTEAVVISVIGGLIGFALGTLLGDFIGSMVELPSQIDIGTVIMAIGFCVLVGVSFGIFPALRAASLDPIEALQKA